MADTRRADPPEEDISAYALAAHRLLGASAVVSMGISTLLRMWDGLPAGEREWLLGQMAAHAATVDDGLKHIAQGVDPDVVQLEDATGWTQEGRAVHLVTSDLVQLAVQLGTHGSDADEAAVELVAVSRRNRQCVEMALGRCEYLPAGDEVDRAVAFLGEALRVGDRRDHWFD